jgi:hypothetical protein
MIKTRKCEANMKMKVRKCKARYSTRRTAEQWSKKLKNYKAEEEFPCYAERFTENPSVDDTLIKVNKLQL